MAPELQIDIHSMHYSRVNSGTEPLIADLSLTAREGSVTSIIAPTGAGKTTLLRIVAGLEHRFVGRVLVGGNAVTRPSRAIQIVFQDSRLIPSMSVIDNVMFAQSAGGSKAQGRAEHLLCAVGLEDRMQAWPKMLSGGEQARVAIARALLDPPKVLLLDEPFRNVDLVTRYRLFRLLETIFADYPMVVILVSHSVDDVVLLSDSVQIMSTRPMKLLQTIAITSPHPRDPGNPAVTSESSAIARAILAHHPLEPR